MPRGGRQFSPPSGQGFLGPGGMADVMQQRAAGLPEPGYMPSFLGSNPGAEEIAAEMGPVMGMLGATTAGKLKDVLATRIKSRPDARTVFGGLPNVREKGGWLHPDGQVSGFADDAWNHADDIPDIDFSTSRVARIVGNQQPGAAPNELSVWVSRPLTRDQIKSIEEMGRLSDRIIIEAGDVAETFVGGKIMGTGLKRINDAAKGPK